MAGRGRLEVSTQGIAGCMAGAAFGQSGQIGGRIPFNGTPQLFEGCDLGTMESVGAAPAGKAVDPAAALGPQAFAEVFPNAKLPSAGAYPHTYQPAAPPAPPVVAASS